MMMVYYWYCNRYLSWLWRYVFNIRYQLVLWCLCLMVATYDIQYSYLSCSWIITKRTGGEKLTIGCCLSTGAWNISCWFVISSYYIIHRCYLTRKQSVTIRDLQRFHSILIVARRRGIINCHHCYRYNCLFIQIQMFILKNARRCS